MSASSSTITVGGWAWPMATSSTTTSRSDLPRLRSSLCRPSPLKVTPTVHHTRTPLPTPTSSPASTRTDSSRVVSGITCPRKPPRPSPRPSSRSTATDRRAHAPHNRDIGRHHVAPCPVLIPSSGKGAPPLPPLALVGESDEPAPDQEALSDDGAWSRVRAGPADVDTVEHGDRRGRVGPAEVALLGWRGRGHRGTPGPLASRSAYSRWWRREARANGHRATS